MTQRYVLKKWVQVVVVSVLVFGFCLLAGDDLNNEMSLLAFFGWKLFGLVLVIINGAILHEYGRRQPKGYFFYS